MHTWKKTTLSSQHILNCIQIEIIYTVIFNQIYIHYYALSYIRSHYGIYFLSNKELTHIVKSHKVFMDWKNHLARKGPLVCHVASIVHGLDFCDSNHVLVQKHVMSHVTKFFFFYNVTKQVISICCSNSKGGSSTILTPPTCTSSPQKKGVANGFWGQSFVAKSSTWIFATSHGVKNTQSNSKPTNVGYLHIETSPK